MDVYHLSGEFRLGNLQISPVHIKIEHLPRVIAAHRHSNTSYEIHYTQKGHGTVTVDDRTYHVLPGTLYITGPGIEHAQKSDSSDPITEYCLYLNCRKTADSRHPSVPADQSYALFADTHFWLGEDRERIFPLMKKLIEENRHIHPDTRDMSELLLKQILILLTRLYRQHDIPEAVHRAVSSSPARMMPVIEDAFLYHYDTLTLSGLSEILSLSIRQTQRILREGFGMTFSQKLTEARMAAGTQLLKETSLSITEIADRLGYSSIEHFSAAFHRQMGCSPRKYRQKSAPSF